MAGTDAYRDAKESPGYTYLMESLDRGSPIERESIYRQLIAHTVELTTHAYGHWVVKELFQVCDDPKRVEILRQIRDSDFLMISRDQCGSHVLKHMMIELNSEYQYNMISQTLRDLMVSLMKERNARQVAEGCFKSNFLQLNLIFIEVATVNCVELATSEHSSYVVQACIPHFKTRVELIQPLIFAIGSHSQALSSDKLGNYAVREVLELKLQWATTAIVDGLKGSYTSMSMHPIGNYVVQQCLKYASDEEYAYIMQEFFENRKLSNFLFHRHGNYVFKQAFRRSKGAVRNRLLQHIEFHESELKKIPHMIDLLTEMRAEKSSRIQASSALAERGRAHGALLPAAKIIIKE